MKRKRVTIYAGGYPKSGTTYLARLVGQVLNCPVGASISTLDKREPATEGNSRPGLYRVRKGHYRLLRGECSKVVPEAHALCYEMLTDEPVLFIMRDPRDIALSAAAWHDEGIESVVKRMIRGKRYGLPRWDEYIEGWLELMADRAVFLHYECLLQDAADEIGCVLHQAGLEFDEERLETAVKRQSFSRVKKRKKSQIDQRLLRRGQAGDWRDNLPAELAQQIEAEFRQTMIKIEYL